MLVRYSDSFFLSPKAVGISEFYQKCPPLLYKNFSTTRVGGGGGGDGGVEQLRKVREFGNNLFENFFCEVCFLKNIVNIWETDFKP